MKKKRTLTYLKKTTKNTGVKQQHQKQPKQKQTDKQ